MRIIIFFSFSTTKDIDPCQYMFLLMENVVLYVLNWCLGVEGVVLDPWICAYGREEIILAVPDFLFRFLRDDQSQVGA